MECMLDTDKKLCSWWNKHLILINKDAVDDINTWYLDDNFLSKTRALGVCLGCV